MQYGYISYHNESSGADNRLLIKWDPSAIANADAKSTSFVLILVYREWRPCGVLGLCHEREPRAVAIHTHHSDQPRSHSDVN